MDISGEFKLNLGREDVWKALMDPIVLSRCIPGCESINQTEKNKFKTKVKLSIGPVKAIFDADINILNLNQPNSYRIQGKGKGGALGFGEGFADVSLIEENSFTILKYKADFKVGGKLAQMGSRLVLSATRQIAENFFLNMSKEIDSQATNLNPNKTTDYKKAIFLALLLLACAGVYFYLWELV